jgi:hypothetical protein
MFNEPEWVDVKSKGEKTGQEYFGRFRMKPFLNLAERADAVRLSELYSRGIYQEPAVRGLLMTVAFLKMHIVETDATWWKEQDGLTCLDEEPVFAIANKLQELQNKVSGKDKKEEKVDLPPVKEPEITSPDEALQLSKKNS